jgi:hypothetical protein
VAIPDTLRRAFRSALDAHERAAVMHDRAADVFGRLGKGPAAERERDKADSERAKAATAIAQHADWL